MSTPELLKGTVRVEMSDGSKVEAPSNTPPELLKAAWELNVLKGKLAEFEATPYQAPEIPAGTNPFAARKIQMDAMEQRSQGRSQLETAINDREGIIAKIQAEQGTLEKGVFVKSDWKDKTAYRAKQIGSAILRGAASVAGAAAAAGAATDPMRYGSPAAPMEEVSRLGLKPQTSGEKYASSAIEGLTGAAMGPGALAAPLRTLATGATIGTGAEAGAQLIDNPAGGVAGGLLAAALLGVPSMLKVPKEQMAQEIVADNSVESLRKAQALQKDIADQGLGSINMAQAMSEPSGKLESLINALANSRHGKKTQAQLNAQPMAASIAADDILAGIPGDVRSPQVVANNVQDAATKVGEAKQKKAGQAYTQAMPEDTSVPLESVKGMVKELEAYKKTLSPTFADIVDDAISHLKTKKPEADTTPQILGAGGQPLNPPKEAVPYLTNAVDIKNELKSALDSYGARKLNTKGLDAHQGKIAQTIRQIVSKVTKPILGDADQAFADVMENEVNTFKKSVTGRLAGKTGADDTVEASVAKLESIFNKGIDPLSKNSEILELQRDLSKVSNGNEAFQDAVKTWMSSKISKATEAEYGQTAPTAAKNLTTLFGDPTKPSLASRRTQDLLVAIARSKGEKDDALLKGVKHAQLLFSRAAKRPGSVGDVDAELLRLANADTARGAGTDAMRWNLLARKWSEWKRKDALEFFDSVVTTPEGFDMIIKLGKENALSPKAVQLLSSYLAVQASTIPETDLKKEEQ